MLGPFQVLTNRVIRDVGECRSPLFGKCAAMPHSCSDVDGWPWEAYVESHEDLVRLGLCPPKPKP